jgi:hypothetical protein
MISRLQTRDQNLWRCEKVPTSEVKMLPMTGESYLFLDCSPSENVPQIPPQLLDRTHVGERDFRQLSATQMLKHVGYVPEASLLCEGHVAYNSGPSCIHSTAPF